MFNMAQKEAKNRNKEVKSIEVFQPDGIDFKAYYDVKHKLTKSGFNIGIEHNNNPVEFYKDKNLTGIVIANGTFKSGGVAIVYFK